MKNTVLTAAAFILFAAGCSPEGKYLGTWLEPVPGMEGQMQGVKIEKGGEASSVNMQTLAYENWTLQGDTLVLTGKSIGNGQTIAFAENFVLKKTDGTWTLQTENGVTVYAKQK